jgi:hypothetical protein
MKLKSLGSITPALMILFLTVLACNLGTAGPPAQLQPSPVPSEIQPVQVQPSLTPVVIDEAPSEVPSPAVVSVVHQVKPADVALPGKLVYDVESADTAAEKRAPYGDSYAINRLERPFFQDMTYLPSLDLSTYTVAQDKDWTYVTMALVGGDANDKPGINYGVELDIDHDGFGDYIIWGHPPYSDAWATSPVQIFQDTNHDTGGLSAEKSDAPLKGDGYDTLIFNGGLGDADPDIAWVRINAGGQSTVQFAFKRIWSGDVYMLGVIADAGLKNPQSLDYVDRFKLADAGSPVRDNSAYPLKALYAVDNICREAFGFKATGYEPQLCPRSEPPQPRKPRPGTTPPPPGCQPPPQGCPYGWAAEPYCICIPG